MSLKCKQKGERENKPSLARKALKLGLAMHLLKIYDQDGIRGVRKDLSDTLEENATRKHQGGYCSTLICYSEEAINEIEVSKAILDDLSMNLSSSF